MFVATVKEIWVPSYDNRADSGSTALTSDHSSCRANPISNFVICLNGYPTFGLVGRFVEFYRHLLSPSPFSRPQGSKATLEPAHARDLGRRDTTQNGLVERLIGSIRRESLDHIIVFDKAQLRRLLRNYASYYNQVRTHLSLEKNAPDFRRPQKLGPIAAIPILGGIHHQYVRV